MTLKEPTLQHLLEESKNISKHDNKEVNKKQNLKAVCGQRGSVGVTLADLGADGPRTNPISAADGRRAV